MESKGFWDDAQLISVYTRKQALADGVLVDISAHAKAFAGARVPTAITCGALAELSEAAHKEEPMGSNKALRMAALAFALASMRRAIDADPSETLSRVDFKVEFPCTTVDMYSLCHGGDSGEPVVTLMLSCED